MKKVCSVLITLFMCSLVLAQNNGLKRVEVEIGDGENYKVLPAGKEGILMFYNTNNKDNKLETWSFSFLNNEFRESWGKQILLPKKLEYHSYVVKTNHIHVLFTTGQLKKAKSVCVSINKKSGELKMTVADIGEVMNISSFEVIDDRIMLGGYSTISKGKLMMYLCANTCTCFIPYFLGVLDTPPAEAFVITQTIGQKTFQIKPKSLKGSTGAHDVQVNEDEFQVLKINYLKKKLALYLEDYDKKGNRKTQIQIKSGIENRGLYSGEVNAVSKDERLVIGLYMNSSNNKLNKNAVYQPDNAPASNGVYIANIKNNKQKYIKYHKFSDFKHFWDSWNTRTSKRAQKKQEKRDAKGKKTSTLGLRLLVHDLLEDNGEYIFTAEAYYPEYHTEYTTDANGNRTTRQVFDGWRYTHAIVAGLDKEGNLLWDQAFPIWNILTKDLRERVKTMKIDNEVVMVYNFRGQLISKTINNDREITSRDITDIQEFSGDKVKNNWGSDVEYWYDNYMVAYGYEKIKNKENKALKGKRKVFYFNKISF